MASQSEKNAQIYNYEIDFISSFQSSIEKICKILKFNSDIISECFKLLMYHFIPINDKLSEYPQYQEIRQFLYDKVGDTTKYIIFSRFLDIIQVFPASEASAERFFARMRDIYDVKQTRLSSSSLRSNLILGFYEEQKKSEHEILMIEED